MWGIHSRPLQIVHIVGSVVKHNNSFIENFKSTLKVKH